MEGIVLNSFGGCADSGIEDNSRHDESAGSKPSSVTVGYWIRICVGILVGQRIQILDVRHAAAYLLDRLIDKRWI